MSDIEQEKEYFKFNVYKTNERLQQFRTKMYEVYYIINLYILANSTYNDFLYTNVENDGDSDAWLPPPFFENLFLGLGYDDRKFLKRQLYYGLTQIIPKYQRQKNN